MPRWMAVGSLIRPKKVADIANRFSRACYSLALVAHYRQKEAIK